jgi:hypothetical protein
MVLGKAAAACVCGTDMALLREAMTADGHELKLETPSRWAPIERRQPHMVLQHDTARGRHAVKVLLQNAPMDGAHGLDTAP